MTALLDQAMFTQGDSVRIAADYDDVTGAISAVHVTNNDTVAHGMAFVWKGTTFSHSCPAGQTQTFTPPPGNIKWATDPLTIWTW